MKILAIETSCDETAAAVARATANRIIIDSNIVASQIDIHQVFGGVVPEVAAREHVKQILPVIDQSLLAAGLKPSRASQELDGLAVTVGPGLMTSLLVGVETAKALALAWNLHLIPINHIVGHISANFINHNLNSINFPLLTLTASGGHTNLLLMHNPIHYQMVGQTLDDAAGEALDKVARLLDLPYPGGPSIQKASTSGKETAFSFPKAMLEGSWDFSFSGVKTAVLRAVEALQAEGRPLPIEDLAASFQAAVVDVLVEKTLLAAQKYKVREIIVAGGVSANKRLREKILAESKYPVHIPPLALCTDNAAMIAAAGYFHFIKEDFSPFDIDVLPNWPLSFSH